MCKCRLVAVRDNPCTRRFGVRSGWTQVQAHMERSEMGLTVSLGSLVVCVGLRRLASRGERPAGLHARPSTCVEPGRRVFGPPFQGHLRRLGVSDCTPIAAVWWQRIERS